MLAKEEEEEAGDACVAGREVIPDEDIVKHERQSHLLQVLFDYGIIRHAERFTTG